MHKKEIMINRKLIEVITYEEVNDKYVAEEILYLKTHQEHMYFDIYNDLTHLHRDMDLLDMLLLGNSKIYVNVNFIKRIEIENSENLEPDITEFKYIFYMQSGVTFIANMNPKNFKYHSNRFTNFKHILI